MAEWLYIGIQVDQIRIRFVEWLSIGNQCELDLVGGNPLEIRSLDRVVVEWLSGVTLVFKWHQIQIRFVEWLSVGNQVT